MRLRASASDVSAYAALSLRYAALCTPMFALWEVAHLPLYTIWWTKPLADSLYAAAHCTLGDAAIAFSTMLVGLAAAGTFAPAAFAKTAASVTLAAGVLVTVGIEFVSTEWLSRWAYSELMPVVPWLGTGLSPIVQWLAVPAVSLYILSARIHDLDRS